MQIIPREFNNIEIDFMKITKEEINTHPFKMFDIMKLFKNIEITYIRDTMMIISLLKLSKIMIFDLFDLLKKYYKCKIITKVIYKREFIIIYFYNLFIAYMFKNINTWMYIDYYHELKELSIDNVYFMPVVLMNNRQYKFKLIIEHNDKRYYFNDEIYEDLDISCLYYIDYKNGRIVNNQMKKMNYFLSNKLKKEEICNLIFEDNY